ncbi:MAG: DUF2905 domain-containing protein [Pseudomonadota bacterium]
MSQVSGNTLIAVGMVLIVAGICFKLGLLSWFGQLPGDIRIERGSTRIYLPVTSMLLVSIGLSAVLGLLRRL